MTENDTYTVDVWVVQQYSEQVEADSPEEARRLAEEIVDEEHWPDEIKESRVVGSH